MLVLALGCQDPQERAAAELARRIVPQYASRIVFIHQADTIDKYVLDSQGCKLHIYGSSANALAAGLGRYLRDYCKADIPWERVHRLELPAKMPLPAIPVSSRALVPQRFFLNYCTFGYAMPWWKWEDWEWFIDWMALQGINLPLAITGQDAIWQEVWRQHGLSDEQIRAWFTGPAHLPWHRMCNIDGVDGPLPQGWIDGQKALQKKIVKRERELGMNPVLPAFGGHVPAEFKDICPDAQITDITGWGGFPPENLPHFLSPQDSLFGVIQKQFLEAQTREYGTGHIYGFDLFNEVAPPSWDPETLAGISRDAYGSVAAVDPEAHWLQMGWMFYYDRKHWTPEIIEAYLNAVPAGRVTILDYYTENVPVWELTDSFYGQPWIFCYLGNFGGNTRLAGPFRKESARIDEALGNANPAGIGCTLEGFGLNKWFYEYMLERAWSGLRSDDEWLGGLDRRRHSPEGFWKMMADSVYLRGSFSEGTLLCGRPCMEGRSSWRVFYETPYQNDVLTRAWKALLDAPDASETWKTDAVTVGSQALANHFAVLRDEFSDAWKKRDTEAAEEIASAMHELLDDIAGLTACEPAFRLSKWIDDAAAWASTPDEEQYYRHNAWHLITTWGVSQSLNDYASRMWSGLVATYYGPRWKMFTDEVLACLHEGREYDQSAIDERVGAFEKSMVEMALPVAELPQAADIPALCKQLYAKWFGKELTLATWNVGVFSKYSEDSMKEAAGLLLSNGVSAVAMCELDSCNHRHGEYQLARFADQLDGWDYRFSRAFDFASGAYGNGIACTAPVVQSYSIALPFSDGAEPRSCAVAETADYVIAAVHLDHKGTAARLDQAKALNDWFTEHYAGYSKPILLCGDFNALPDDPAIAAMSGCWTRLSGDSPTYPSYKPAKCIDYIFALTSAGPVHLVSETIPSSLASDHLPIILSVKY